MKINKSWIGRSVLFVAFNGMTYNAIVTEFRKKIVTLQYQLAAWQPETYHAYLEPKDWHRVTLRFFPRVENSNGERV